MSDFVQQSQSRQKVSCNTSYYLPFILLVAVLSVFYMATWRSGVTWNPDSGLFIMHARNIVEGRPFALVNYIYNPLNVIHPSSYPPGLPLLLSPIYALFGLNLEIMKIEMIMFVFILCVLSAIVARQYLSTRLAFTTIAIFGLNPYIYGLTTVILSDFLFMVFCYASLLAVYFLQYSGDKRHPVYYHAASVPNSARDFFVQECLPTNPQQPAPRHRGWLILVASASLALAEETRSIGIVLFPTILIAGLIRMRSAGWTSAREAATILALGAAGIVGIKLLFPADAESSYITLAIEDYSPMTPLLSMITYLRCLPRDIFLLHFMIRFHSLAYIGVPVAFLLWLVGMILGFYGFSMAVFRRSTAFEVFAAVYIAFILVYPIAVPSRYIMPVFPLMFIYVVVGLSAFAKRFGPRPERALLVTCLGLTLLAYSASYAGFFTPDPKETERRPLSISPLAPPYQALLAAIRDQTPPNAVILADHPTTIGLFADRRAATWPSDYQSDFWRYARSIGASYVVKRIEGPERISEKLFFETIGEIAGNLTKSLGWPLGLSERADINGTDEHPQHKSFSEFMAHQMRFVQPVFSNEYFTLYHITQWPETGTDN